MSNCIYCRKESTGTVGMAHAIPESLCQNGHTMPRGAICDSCNSYLSDLDNALILHKQISLAIQVFAVPGKKGRPRIELGCMQRRDPSNLNKVTIEGKGKNLLYINGNHIRIETAEVPGWNLSKFRRALHYLALNIVALNLSAQHVLDPRYDKVRNYIRHPQRNEDWPYGEFQRTQTLYQGIEFHRRNAPGEVIELGLFHFVFVVDLMDTPNFKESVLSAIPGCKAI